MSDTVRKALEGLLRKYVELVESGDCGNWDAEKEPEVIAARAALASGGWRDIGTAPKDGTLLDIADHEIVEVGAWEDERPEIRECGMLVEGGWDAGWWGNEFFPGNRQPTHWRPRPLPPAPEQS